MVSVLSLRSCFTFCDTQSDSMSSYSKWIFVLSHEAKLHMIYDTCCCMILQQTWFYFNYLFFVEETGYMFCCVIFLWYQILFSSWSQSPNVLVLSRSRHAQLVQFWPQHYFQFLVCFCSKKFNTLQCGIWNFDLTTLPWEKQVGVLVPTDSSGRQPGLHQAEYDFLHGGKLLWDIV